MCAPPPLSFPFRTLPLFGPPRVPRLSPLCRRPGFRYHSWKVRLKSVVRLTAGPAPPRRLPPPPPLSRPSLPLSLGSPETLPEPHPHGVSGSIPSVSLNSPLFVRPLGFTSKLPWTTKILSVSGKTSRLSCRFGGNLVMKH